MSARLRGRRAASVEEEKVLPLRLPCSARLCKHMFRESNKQDEDRLVSRFCVADEKMDEVLSAFLVMQWKGDNGVDEGLTAKSLL